MGTKSAIAIGGGSGAVVTSAHAGCARFRGTDPLITGMTRRKLASELGVPKSISGSIPDSRWIRALTFQSLVHDEKFASRIVQQTLAGAGLPKPSSVSVLNANEELAETQSHLEKALSLAINGIATLIYSAAVPPRGFDEQQATLVYPDFIVVASNPESPESAVLLVGDAKDYERIRSKIEDTRMLKGFLQVAFGILAFETWGSLPKKISVSRFGALAVPRNAFLQPTVVTENLTDHCEEVLMRLQQRVSDAENLKWSGDAEEFASHLEAAYDPDTCRTCPLFEYCRNQLRDSKNNLDILQEIGIPRSARKRVEALITGGLVDESVPSALLHRITASMTGKALPTGRRRTDTVLSPGSVNLLMAKSDSAALGVYGVSVQVVNSAGVQPWKNHVFNVPQADSTRRELLQVLGESLLAALDGQFQEVGKHKQLSIASSDQATLDVLASIADTVAGNEISRLRWTRDLEMNRPALTFDGNPAVLPEPLSEEQRLATSFLIEEDRARAFQTRKPTIDLVSILNELMVVGGPVSSSGRLDYLTEWTTSIQGTPIDFRALESDVESRANTPGARLTVLKSNEINQALVLGKQSKDEMSRYKKLVLDELKYKQSIFDTAISALSYFPVSVASAALAQVEREAQSIWRRRVEFHAFDLVRFGLTPRNWRNALVEVVEKDATCLQQLNALLNPSWADSQAKVAGNRVLAIARVESLSPLKLRIDSRQFSAGSEVVFLHKNGFPLIEVQGVIVKPLVTFIQVRGLEKAFLTESDGPEQVFECSATLHLEVGDQLVVANTNWFLETNRSDEIKIVRPKLDNKSAPMETCDESSFLFAPEEHRWCCRPHEVREAETSDFFAAQREAGKMNPQAWPPVVDAEAFDQESPSEPKADDLNVVAPSIPETLTMDELD